MPKNMTEEQRKKWNEYQREYKKRNAAAKQQRNEYMKENAHTFSFTLYVKSDAEMIAYLETKKPYCSYLKALVRADMELHAQKNDNIEGD